jgi:hypothetical protein
MPSAPPYQPPLTQYPPPPYQQNYTYAVKPQEQMIYYQNYPQTYAYQYNQQQPQQRQMNAGAAFVGGLVLGTVMEDILDPCD